MSQPVKIDRNSYTPIYIQIREDLKRLIEEEKSHREQFYSDEELVQMYGVNRLTVRRAVEKLVDEGYLYRVRGVGTFMSSPKINMPAAGGTNLNSFEEQCRKAGKVCVVKVTEMKLVQAPPAVQAVLQRDEVCYLERLRYVDQIPMVLDKFYFPAEVMAGISKEACCHLKMPEILNKATGIVPSYAVMEAEAVLATHEDGEKLQISVQDPLLLRKMRIYLKDDSTAVVGKTLNRGDLFRLIVRVSY